jgi:hypothetical protein
MTIAAAHLGPPSLLSVFAETGSRLPSVGFGETGTVETKQSGSRELAAIGDAAEWINSPRLTTSSLAGKVVLVDFWTYTCINWLRTLPYLRAWEIEFLDAGVEGFAFTFG